MNSPNQIFTLRVENYNLKYNQITDKEGKEYVQVSMPGITYKVYDGYLPSSLVKNLKLVCWTDLAIVKLSEHLSEPSKWTNNQQIKIDTGIIM